MGLSKAMLQLRQTRLTLINDVEWCIDMVKDLESDNLSIHRTKEHLISELKSILESIYENING